MSSDADAYELSEAAALPGDVHATVDPERDWLECPVPA
jgi:hypothetical protein